MISQGKEIVTVPTSARAWIHLQSRYDPVRASVSFCGYSFEHMAQVLMGDVAPEPCAFLVFDQIVPEHTPVIIDIERCAELLPIFAFGHELVDV